MNIEELLKRWTQVTADMAAIIQDLQRRNDVLEEMNARQARTILLSREPNAPTWHGIPIDEQGEEDVGPGFAGPSRADLAELVRENTELKDKVALLSRGLELSTSMGIDYNRQIERQLEGMGLFIDGDDFGTNRPTVQALYDDRGGNVTWRPMRKRLAHIGGVPVYVSGLVGTAPENWTEINKAGAKPDGTV